MFQWPSREPGEKVPALSESLYSRLKSLLLLPTPIIAPALVPSSGWVWSMLPPVLPRVCPVPEVDLPSRNRCRPSGMLKVVDPLPEPYVVAMLVNRVAYVVRLSARPSQMSQRVCPSGSTGSVDPPYCIIEPTGAVPVPPLPPAAPSGM